MVLPSRLGGLLPPDMAGDIRGVRGGARLFGRPRLHISTISALGVLGILGNCIPRIRQPNPPDPRGADLLHHRDLLRGPHPVLHDHHSGAAPDQDGPQGRGLPLQDAGPGALHHCKALAQHSGRADARILQAAVDVAQLGAECPLLRLPGAPAHQDCGLPVPQGGGCGRCAVRLHRRLPRCPVPAPHPHDCAPRRYTGPRERWRS
mmetsp:Transcript_36774/g.59431  ORF Transcript_36774/g.59431 Transcript_36774/m.59431 type:complete len:205 (-) Transcript_36774:2404-3018(-)